MRLFAALALLATFAAASTPESIGRGLGAESRGAREAAEAAARQLARTDPGGVDALWQGLDGRGRRMLVRALASAGTRHAALVALQHAGDPSPEIFRALLRGLARGGQRALFAEIPKDLGARRRKAIELLRLRWKIEEELVRLKSPAGSTGHYTGQFSGFKRFGAGVAPVFFDIMLDQAVPLLGEASSGPFQSIHPLMERYDRRELRDLVANGFGEITDKTDRKTIDRLHALFDRFWKLDEDEFDFEHNNLAPALAYSLHDLDEPGPSRQYLRRLRLRESTSGLYDRLRAMWSLGYANIRLGNYAEGEKWYGKILDMPPRSSVSREIAAYNLACNFAMRAARDPKHRDKFRKLALDYLDTAVYRLNWWDWGWMQADGDLAFIRDEPRYKRVLRHLKSKWPDRRKGKHSKDPKDFLGGK